MRILIASSNPHKLQEIGDVFDELREQSDAKLDVELVGLDAFEPIDEPVEDQPTFEGNAVLKAAYYATITKTLCLADDSGLEVDCIDGEPGVISARYSGAEGPRSVVDPANNTKLLKRLGDTPADERTARFVCTMALLSPDRAAPLALVRGTIEGRILGPGDEGYAIDNPAGRGSNGFGYDPLFLVPKLGKTTAELSPAEKNAISHRGAASRMMWGKLVQRFA